MSTRQTLKLIAAWTAISSWRGPGQSPQSATESSTTRRDPSSTAPLCPLASSCICSSRCFMRAWQQSFCYRCWVIAALEVHQLVASSSDESTSPSGGFSWCARDISCTSFLFKYKAREQLVQQSPAAGIQAAPVSCDRHSLSCTVVKGRHEVTYDIRFTLHSEAWQRDLFIEHLHRKYRAT
mmetsp:Transcript_143688/g.358162  ORF Transcript_143688/g.358162 Transcript_143688/m.358162 type:complete len:181 (+) Transcript_143688:1509-2051(+)